MKREIAATIKRGTLYHFRDQGTYRVLFFAYNGVTMQEMVVYRGMDDAGPDADRFFVCTLGDFATKFVEVAPDASATTTMATIEVTAAEPVTVASLPEKPAGAFEGSPY